MNKKFIMLLMLIIILLINPRTTLSGAVCGLNLWFQVIVPTLLPFMIISYLIQNVYGTTIKNPLWYVILIGLTCGYPMGAYAAISMYQKNRISQKQAYLLLMCCNISSPAFVLSYISFTSLEITTFPCEILTINYLPVLLVLCYLLLTTKRIRIQTHTNTQALRLGFDTLDSAITSSILNILKLGVYIILFSILATLIRALPIENTIIKCLLIGIAEITTGINYAVEQNLSTSTLVPLILVMNAFGGLSCAFQSSTFLKEGDLSIKKYMYYKILLAVLTFLTWYLVVHVFHVRIL